MENSDFARGIKGAPYLRNLKSQPFLRMVSIVIQQPAKKYNTGKTRKRQRSQSRTISFEKVPRFDSGALDLRRQAEIT